MKKKDHYRIIWFTILLSSWTVVLLAVLDTSPLRQIYLSKQGLITFLLRATKLYQDALPWLIVA